MEKLPKETEVGTEQSIDGAFANLPSKVAELLEEVLDGKKNLDYFFSAIEGIPGKDNFYKRLRHGSRVKVLRSSGEMDDEGWIINQAPKEGDLTNNGTVVVHNKKLHLVKTIPLIDLLRWNI